MKGKREYKMRALTYNKLMNMERRVEWGEVLPFVTITVLLKEEASVNAKASGECDEERSQSTSPQIA